MMAPPPAGAGPVPRPRHPAAAHLQQESRQYSDTGGKLLRRITASFVNVGYTEGVRVHTQLSIFT